MLTLRSHLLARPPTDPTDLDFKGHFHQTRPRRLLRSSLKIVGILAACYIGGFGIICFNRFQKGGTIPPHIWARTAEQQTREEVEKTLAEGFNLARNRMLHQRNDALREATFHVPHELARLNKDAPDFRLEDLGPMVHAKKVWDRLGEIHPSLAPYFDCAEETRVFLYFPNDATKATAVFVAVNAEPLRKLQRSSGVGEHARRAVEAAWAVNVWKIQHEIWAQSHPAVIGRIEEMQRLPVIFNFRDEAFGLMYYTRLGLILDGSMWVTPLTVTDLDRGILQKRDCTPKHEI